MSKYADNKHRVWVLLVLVIITMTAEFASNVAANSSIPTATATSTQQADTLTITYTPGAESANFAVKTDGIRYTHFPTNGTPCYFFISGTVSDLYGLPYLDFLVNIVDVTTGQAQGYANPGADITATTSEPSGWSILLSQQPAIYEIWLTTRIGGDELSSHVRLQMQSCDQNQAIVDFVQIKTLPGQKPSNVPLVMTLAPHKTIAPFTVENNQISYTYSPSLGKPCYYEMVGRVLDQKGKPFTGFVVNIKMLGDLAPPTPGYAMPGEGYAEDGSSGWATILPSSPENYEIWLTTRMGGEEISPHIFVPTRDCVHNLARVNFVQIRPLS